MISDTGAGLYGCKASVDMFGFTMDDFVPQVKDIITVGEFYDMAARRRDRLHLRRAGGGRRRRIAADLSR